MLDRVISIRQAAEKVGVSVPTFRRVIEAGEGPPVIQLSTRRLGVRESDVSKWLNDRVRDHLGNDGR
jgi:excisionase family DNA binding protein